ncbi:MAG: hypothetical protein H6R15_2175 [Proteobacteria bacterium]|nr:hypothetical protein [Pseudomonadota bacterium]
MSYVVHFWSRPMPKSLDQAIEIFAALQNESRTQNPLFQMLAKRLTARFPCIMELEEDDPRMAWTDGPLNGITQEATYGIGILTDKIDEVQPFVVETATTLGLVVMDDQQGEVYLPGGTVLNSAGARPGKHLGMELAGNLSAALVERTLQDAMYPLLLAAGFEEIKALGGWWRTLDQGAQSLRLNIMESSSESVTFDVEVTVTNKHIKPVVEVMLQSAGQGAEKLVATATSSLALFSLFFRTPSGLAKVRHPLRFEIKSIDELRTLAIELREMIVDHVIPILDTCNNVKNLAAFITRDDTRYNRIIGSLVETKNGFITSRQVSRNLFATEGCGGPLTAVILAALAEDPKLQEVIERAYRQVSFMSETRSAAEKAKLDFCVKALNDQNRSQ